MVALETMIAVGAVITFFGFFSRILRGGRKSIVSIGMILVGVSIAGVSGAALILGL